jgi:hypothetical protein
MFKRRQVLCSVLNKLSGNANMSTYQQFVLIACHTIKFINFIKYLLYYLKMSPSVCLSACMKTLIFPDLLILF